MATTYKTPGVYVEEISKFPPIIAQVETAIPAFLGYTEKATKKMDGDLSGVPTRITSMLEYEQYFGYARPETTIQVNMDDQKSGDEVNRTLVVVPPSTPEPYLMYYSMQMYFANGGGPCYIVSVSNYTDNNGAALPITFNNLKSGLDKLKEEDEVTLLLFPDAKALSEVDFYNIYQDALTQCNEMQDRFTIIDTHQSSDIETDSDALRNRMSLGGEYLRYGAAYYPYLETILDYNYDENSIIINHTTNLPNATKTALAQVADYESQMTEVDTVMTSNVPPNSGVIRQASALITSDFADFPGTSLATLKASGASLNTILEQVVNNLSNFSSLAQLVTNAGTAAARSIEEGLGDHDADAMTPDTNPQADAIMAALATMNGHLDGAGNMRGNETQLRTAMANLANANSKAKIQTQVTNITNRLNAIFEDGVTDVPSDVIGTIPAIQTAITAGDALDINNAELNGRSLASIKDLDSRSYHEIKQEISNMPVILPPSSAMAGIYARVDSSVGVWQAPANVGVKYLMKPSLKITNEQQRNLNIHTEGGKSINAIRTFTGRGTLVWGARTLAGNDPENNYVNVRRTLNMIEESIEKATNQFVFRPNDAKTWVKVRAMIENFLTNQWRSGALVGAKPEHAFYVRIGLGQTMTANDILEGKMIVEVGLAITRPAEFIILKFSHKMQES